MADTYIVQVDLEQVRLRYSKSEQRELSDDDARLLLIRYGFYPRVDGLYLAEEAILQQLEPSEVIAARPVAVVVQQ